MIKRRVTLSIILVVALWPLVALGVPEQGTAPEAVVAAAHDGLQRLLGAIPPGELEHFGFRTHAELAQASLGKPFMVYTMYPQEILACVEGKSKEVSIHSTSMWLFPILADGTPRTLLTVDRMPGKWEAVDLGGLSPAAEMEELAARWPPAEEYQLKYVQVFQTGSQFVCLTKGDNSRLVPLEGTARSLGILGEREVFQYHPMDIPEAVSILAPFVRSALVRRQG